MDTLCKQDKRGNAAILSKMKSKRELYFFLNHTELSTFEISAKLGIKEEEVERTI
jgi:hypothetical protein